MVSFKISTGELFAQPDPDGVYSLIGHGYSGNGDAINDPAQTDKHAHGPLPVGHYSIGSAEDRPQSVGAFALPLTPDPANQMFGRSGFFVHGDNPQQNQTASDGCVVTARPVREIIAQHQTLTVIA